MKNKLDQKPNVKYEIDIDKVIAPLKKGDVIGKMKVEIDNNYEIVNLTIKNDLKRITFIELLMRKFGLFLK